MWVRSFETIEELRLALLAFKRTYNEQWIWGNTTIEVPPRSDATSSGWTRQPPIILALPPILQSPPICTHIGTIFLIASPRKNHAIIHNHTPRIFSPHHFPT